MGHPQGIAVLVFTWMMVGLTFLLVALRMNFRLSYRSDKNNFSFSDAFVGVAWISFVIQAGFTTSTYYEGIFSARATIFDLQLLPLVTTQTLKNIYVSGTLYMNGPYAIKAAVLCVYREIIPLHQTKTRVCWWLLAVFTAISWVLQLAFMLTTCLPLDRFWTHDIAVSCYSSPGWDWQFYVYFPTHIATDLLIYLFPIPTLLPLLRGNTLSQTQKIAVSASFSSGFLCIAAALALQQITLKPWTAFHGHENEVVYIFYAVEHTTAIVVCCTPAAVQAVRRAWALLRARNAEKQKVEKTNVEDVYGGSSELEMRDTVRLTSERSTQV